MNKMKVLWLSNCVLGNTISNGSGSWLFAMSKIIRKSVELVNMTSTTVDEVVCNKYEDLTEVIIPNYKLKNGLPSEGEINQIVTAVEEIKPDIIHIWGIEGFWAQLYVDGYIKGNVIVEIQGLLHPCYEVFWGGLNPYTFVFKSLCIRNLLYGSSFLPKRRRIFQKRGEQSESVLGRCKVVSTQSNWVREQIQFVLDSKCKIYKTLRPIRNEFWEAEKWHKHSGSCRIFTSMSYFMPFKGIHVLIKAVSILKKKYSNVVLEIAGVEQSDLVWYRQFSYTKYLRGLSKHLGIEDNVVYVERLSAKQIVEHLHRCDVFVNPSFVESFSASTAEALAMGVPTVAAYSGAMPDFSTNKDVALYYSPMDYTACAAKILTLIENEDVRNELCCNAQNEIAVLCGSENVHNVQLSIYKDVFDNAK